MALVAAPAYLARRGVPQTPYDLDAHNCIAFNFARYCDEWPFVVDGMHLSLPARGDVVAGDGEISRRLGVGGVRFGLNFCRLSFRGVGLGLLFLANCVLSLPLGFCLGIG